MFADDVGLPAGVAAPPRATTGDPSADAAPRFPVIPANESDAFPAPLAPPARDAPAPDTCPPWARAAGPAEEAFPFPPGTVVGFPFIAPPPRAPPACGAPARRCDALPVAPALGLSPP